MFVAALLLRVALAAKLVALSQGTIAPGRAFDVARDVLNVADDEGDIDDAPIAIVFGYGESGWRPLVGDGGASCGELQIGEIVRAGHSCAEVLHDRRLAIALWLRALHRLDDVCESRSRALGAIASGKCGGAAKLVARRMAEANL